MGDKRKTLPKMIDMRSLPSRRGHKKAKHKLSKSGVIKPSLVVLPAPTKQPSIQIFDLDLSNTPETTLSKPPRCAPMNLLENEDLA